MDTLPLPPRPNLSQYKKRAKDLVTAATSTEPDAVREWATEWLQTLAHLLGVTVSAFVQASFDRAVETVEKPVQDRLTKPKARWPIHSRRCAVPHREGARLRELGGLRRPRRPDSRVRTKTPTGFEASATPSSPATW